MTISRLSAVLLLLACASCGSRPFRGEEGAPKAVVLSTAARDRDSERVAQALQDRGYDVLRKSTTIPRARTSASVYAVRDNADRVNEIAKVLTDCGVAAPDVLPFQQHGSGGNVVVVWLGDE